MKEETKDAIVVTTLLGTILFFIMLLITIETSVVEYYPPNAFLVKVQALTADTVIIIEGVNKGDIVRMIGYEAYDLGTEKGREAKEYLDSLCSKESYLIIQEQVQRQGQEQDQEQKQWRGYLWCGDEHDGYKSIQRLYIVDRQDLAERIIYTPSDQYPFYLWQKVKKDPKGEDRGAGFYKVCTKTILFNTCKIHDLLTEQKTN